MRGDKLLAAMRAHPHDWRITDVERLCRAYGLTCLPPRHGSHYKVTHSAMQAILTIPARRPIKQVYIRDLVHMIDALTREGR
ncbi:type II toxin-antitoxin system HicA family toxin [Sphingomonas sp. BK069]|uniref:type II toxin-antitoxin system HicA family toxin n=1 Tax=Sphingomonas sp. BK069 TaxID=2586979 RepID=UPI001615BC6C|nr:type II toxin-antitoxin system HicA family toxin [Sphingomonas sp. BK069]MBB3348880.1 2-hydroxychromene-2-carboxylate isomerase [Sphingomonas sp. BK069]